MKVCQTTASFSQLAFAVALLLLLNSSTFAQTPQTRTGLPLTETPVEYTIGGTERLRHLVTLAQNEFLQVRVEQKHADVLLTLLDAGGNESTQMNFLDRDDVVETLSFVAAQKGDYVLEVRMVDAKAASGSYTIRREVPRKAEARDSRRVAVEKLFMEAMLQRSKEWDLKNAIDKMSEALAGWQELADSYMAELTAWKLKQTKAVAGVRGAQLLMERKTLQSYQKASEELLETAHAFHEIDDVNGECAALLGASTLHAFLGDSALSPADKTVHYKQAISLSQQALPLLRKLSKQRDDELELLAQIAMMARIIGDKYMAIEYMIQTVPLYKQPDGLSKMATTENTIGGLYIEIDQYKDGLEYLNRALAHREKDKCGTRATLTNIGIAYSAMGEKATALEYLRQADCPFFR
jgi:tetratricopeptide (TPR) repeat protein